MDKDIEKFMKRIIAIFMVLALVLSGECMAAARQEKAPPGDKPAENSQPKSENQAAALKAAENALDKKDFARAADILKDLAKRTGGKEKCPAGCQVFFPGSGKGRCERAKCLGLRAGPGSGRETQL